MGALPINNLWIPIYNSRDIIDGRFIHNIPQIIDSGCIHNVPQIIDNEFPGYSSIIPRNYKWVPFPSIISRILWNPIYNSRDIIDGQFIHNIPQIIDSGCTHNVPQIIDNEFPGYSSIIPRNYRWVPFPSIISRILWIPIYNSRDIIDGRFIHNIPQIIDSASIISRTHPSYPLDFR
jgi:hypothetical protein